MNLNYNWRQIEKHKGRLRYSLLLIFLSTFAFILGCQAESNKPFLDIRTDIANSEIDFFINQDVQKNYYYKIDYNDREYKQYTKSDNEWSILYDYSYRDVTKVSISVYEEQGSSELLFSKSILIVIDPSDYDFSNNVYDIYYASRYDITLDKIVESKGQLLSIDLEGDQPSGDLSKLLNCSKLKYISLNNCPNISGLRSDLDELASLDYVYIHASENIK